jgi:hypothetical protein
MVSKCCSECAAAGSGTASAVTINTVANDLSIFFLLEEAGVGN